MQGHKVQLYAILLDGALNRYPKVEVIGEGAMPSRGALSNPDDKALVTSLEDKMIEAYGTALVEVKCKAAGGKRVDLMTKMLRPMHVGALFAAVERYQVAELGLGANQLGAAGGELVAAALKTNTTLTTLRCARLGQPSNLVPRVGFLVRPWHRHAKLAAFALFTFFCRVRSLGSNKLGPAAGMAIAEALKGNTTLTSLESAALCHRTHPPVRPGPLTCIIPCTSPPPTLSHASQHRPARAVNATSHSLRVPRTSPARAQPTRGLRMHRAHGRPRANTLAAATSARTRRGPRPRPPLPTCVWRVRVHAPTCTCPSQAGLQRPRRRRQEGPQSGRRQRPQAGALAFGNTGDRAVSSATRGEVPQ
eukprot:scaffold82224_cov52-Phaeocystis_antarctica.AAC.1